MKTPVPEHFTDKKLKVATCTPTDFEASPRFFSRDTGLLCRGFQSAGYECKVIMPGVAKPDDSTDLLRCSFSDLEDPAWWKARELDLVVLYAWVKPRHLPIAKAIRQAGIKLVQSMDTAGLQSPYSDFKSWAACSMMMCSMPQGWQRRMRALARSLRDWIPSLFEKKRLRMMAECDALAVVSPPAYESINQYARTLGSPDVAKKTVVIPHPVSDEMQYDGRAKEKKLIVVGRWGHADATQKDPVFHLRIIEKFLAAHPAWSADFIGNSATSLTPQLRTWSPEVSSRIELIDFVPHDVLREKYASASIMLCASRYESFHIASAEAVCSGCSIVVPKHPMLASTGWFTSHESGTISGKRNLSSITAALELEASNWENEKRAPLKIARYWKSVLPASCVASKLAEMNKKQDPA